MMRVHVRRDSEWIAGSSPAMTNHFFVMPALVAGIHDFLCRKDVDGRDEPGHDGMKAAWPLA
jgi:hypothetical protein